MRARWNVVDYVLENVSVDRWDGNTASPRRPTKRSPGRSPPGATRNCATTPAPSWPTSPAAPRKRSRRAGSAAPTGDAPERAAAADRRQPDLISAMRRADDEQLLQRLHPLATAARRRRRSGPGAAGDRAGMPEPAGTGLSRRKFLSRSAGLALASTAPRRSRSRPSRPGSPRPPGRQDPSSRSSSTAASTRSSVLAPVGDPNTRRCGPNLAERNRAKGRPSPRTRGCQWHPSAAGLATSTAAESQRLPGDRLRTPRPVAFHLAPLLRDRPARRRLPHRLDGPLPRPRRRRRKPAGRDFRWTARSRR